MPTLHVLTPEFDAFRMQFEQLADEADRLAGAFTEEQFIWRPSPDSWSVAECLEHLNATARAYLPFLDEAIAEAIRKGWYRPGPFRHNLIGRLSVYLLEPPPRLRIRAPAVFEPQPTRGRQQTLAAFRAYQVQYVDRLRQGDGLDLARSKAQSPAAYSWVRIPLGSAFMMMVSHERRHLWQAARVLEAPGFPRA